MGLERPGENRESGLIVSKDPIHGFGCELQA